MKNTRRSLWPWGIAAGLTFAVSVNLTMVGIALQHRSPLVPGDPEADALAFDETIARRRAAEALGWRVTVGACAPDPRGACIVTVEVVEGSGRAVEGLAGHAVARRSDDARFDRETDLHALGAGRYTGTLPAGVAGAYTLELELDGASSPWVGVRELWIPEAMR